MKAGRRSVLRAGLMVVASPFIGLRQPGLQPIVAEVGDPPVSYNAQFGNPPLLGRVEARWEALQSILRDPASPDSVVRITRRREVIPIYGAIHAPPPFPRYKHNDVWFDVGEGYIHSSYVIPVHEEFHEPVAVSEGMWGEIGVPLAQQHWQPDLDSRGQRMLAYGTVYRVAARADDSSGRAWYRLTDDGVARAWWVQATQVRPIPVADFAPISPAVAPGEKRIVVSIGQQLLTCYEYETAVFSTRIASGTAFINPKGEQFGFSTPIGTHNVVHKRPSRHMVGGDPDSAINRYDLPGVAWCTYFTYTGAAIHGTYWHNNFGRPQSHGCINVTNDAALWIYRWVNPFTGTEEDNEWTGKEDRATATQINIEE